MSLCIKLEDHLVLVPVECITVEPLIKDIIEITSEQRTSFNVPNGDFLYS